MTGKTPADAKDPAILEYRQAHHACHGKYPEITTRHGWYYIDGSGTAYRRDSLNGMARRLRERAAARSSDPTSNNRENGQMPLSDRETHIIRHALGVEYGKPPYREHYCVRDGNEELEALVKKGLMRHGHLINNERTRVYLVTEAGAAAVGSSLPPD